MHVSSESHILSFIFFVFFHQIPLQAHGGGGDSIKFTSAIRWTWPVGPVSQLNEREITSSATVPLSAPLLQLLRLEVENQARSIKKLNRCIFKWPINVSKMKGVCTGLIVHGHCLGNSTFLGWFGHVKHHTTHKLTELFNILGLG